MAKTIYFVAGEISADNHGAALIRSLRELSGNCSTQFIGRGGPQMRAIAGAGLKNWIGDAAVLGLWEVIRKYSYFRDQFRQTLAEIEASKPDAVVLIDYPGFNLRLAEAVRPQSPQQKIIYYISPQVWAWNRGRIKKMARLIDLVLCIFPFEVDLYDKSGLRAVFVGHPMLERLEPEKAQVKREADLIGLFPGSRLREVRKIFPVLMEATKLLQRTRRSLRFEVAAASVRLATEINKMLDEARDIAAHNRLRIQVIVDQTAAIMQRAFVGIVASGTATLEAAYFRLPFVLVYKVAWPTYVAARFVVRVKYLGMPNVLANREVVPEFIQHRAQPKAVANAVSRLIENEDARAQMIAAFGDIVRKLGNGGASKNAAQAIVDEIGRSR